MPEIVSTDRIVPAILITVLLFVTSPKFAPAGEIPEKNLPELTMELGLSSRQQSSVAEILAVSEKQAQNDRKINAGNPAALIEAARRRRATQDNWIEKILEEWQLERLQHYKRERSRREELFLLSEGLSLSPEQSGQADFIIRLYNSRIEDLGGSILPPPGAGRRGEMRPTQAGPSDEIKSLQSKKEKEIKAILDKQQRKLYKSVLKIIREERLQGIKPGRDGSSGNRRANSPGRGDSNIPI